MRFQCQLLLEFAARTDQPADDEEAVGLLRTSLKERREKADVDNRVLTNIHSLGASIHYPLIAFIPQWYSAPKYPIQFKHAST